MSTMRQMIGRGTLVMGSLFGGASLVHNLFAPDLVRPCRA